MESTSDNKFRSVERIRKPSDFASVFQNQTKKKSDRFLRVHIAKNNLPLTRLGVSVSKRVGNAVVRNAIKRRLREAFRKKKAGLPAGFDVVCVASICTADSLDAVATSFHELLNRIFQSETCK